MPRLRFSGLGVANFLAPFIHRQFFVQPGNHFPNPCLGEALRAKRMLLLYAVQSLL